MSRSDARQERLGTVVGFPTHLQLRVVLQRDEPLVPAVEALVGVRPHHDPSYAGDRIDVFAEKNGRYHIADDGEEDAYHARARHAEPCVVTIGHVDAVLGGLKGMVRVMSWMGQAARKRSIWYSVSSSVISGICSARMPSWMTMSLGSSTAMEAHVMEGVGEGRGLAESILFWCRVVVFG